MSSILETVRNVICVNSEIIFKLKQEYKPIGPKSSKWLEYIGRKKQVTLFLVILHLYKGSVEKISSHTKNKSLIIDAKKYLEKLEENVKKEAKNA